jgi:hypothetical protein
MNVALAVLGLLGIILGAVGPRISGLWAGVYSMYVLLCKRRFESF